MKHLKLLLVVILSITLTTSCWSRKEIERLGFVMGIGIAKTEAGLYSLTVQVANPSIIVAEAPEQRDVYTIIQAEGLSLFDALRNLSLKTSRRLYIAHIRSIVIHESVARKGLSDLISFLVHDMEVRLESEVFISKIPPDQLLDTPNTLGAIPAVVLQTAAKNYKANSKVYISDLHKTVEAVNNPATNYVTTLVEIEPAPTDKEMPQLKLTKIAVFNNDRLKGYLDYEEGQGFNLITNNFGNALIIFKSHSSQYNITMEMLESKATVKPTIENGSIHFKIQLKASGNIAGTAPHRGRKKIELEKVQKELSAVLEDKMEKSIKAAQDKFQIDYFNLSGEFAKKYPKEFQTVKDDWNEVFSTANIEIQVDTKVIHSALNNNEGRI